ncbi:serine-rich adhesin for platelets isoform X2 [Eurosta solidaginis]|uniref:serine-rich adhesin for platelets isoform X2 n=1 Tax=Eurosta solidaginis TaxID=178769 RepID=UPI0035316B26
MSNQLRLLLFIVVISGALCTVEDYVIMSQCAHNKAIHVAAEGTVSVTDISQTQNITIVGLPDYVNNNLKIALYAKETQRYLCFNEQWKLVGMKELRDTCYFNETIVHGYFVFRSVVDLQRRVGFTHRGKAVGPKKNVNDACYLFTKIQADQFFHQHTNYLAPKSKSTKNNNNNNGISTSQPHRAAATTTTATHTTSGASARMSTQRAALSAAATATATATAAHRNHSNNKNKRVNGIYNNNSNNNSKNKNNNNNNNRNNSNNNQNEEYTKGHSSNLSNNNSNNSSLDSNNQQQVVLSHQKHHNNHSNNSNNNNNKSRTREHVRHHQQHQVRHHHNDPNLIARRQQHEHKQKRRPHQRQQQRTRSGKITSPTTNTTTKIAQPSAPTTAQVAYNNIPRGSNKSKQHNNTHELEQQQRAINLSDVAEKVATATTITMKSTTIANKRKGRRRKGRKHKKQQQQMSLRSQQLGVKEQQTYHSAALPTLPSWMLSESPTPAEFTASSTQVQKDNGSSISTSTSYSDYSGEWLSSLATFAEETPEAQTSASSLLPSLSSSDFSYGISHASTHAYSLSTKDVGDDLSSLTPTIDYTNITDFTSEDFGEVDAFNATFVSEIDDENLTSETTLAIGAQLNSINSQPQQYLTTTLHGAASVSEEQSLMPTLTTFFENSDHSWSPATIGSTIDSDVAETMLATPKATIETERVTRTSISIDADNVTAADDAYSNETMNSTSSEIAAESGSFTSGSTSIGLTDSLTDISGIAPTMHDRSKSANVKRKPKKPSSIAASIATLFYNQLLATNSRQNNKYAWKPQHGDEYSEEIVTEKASAATEATTTEIAESERAEWWQQHMNHSGNYFWDKGFDEIPLTASSEIGWHKRGRKHKNAGKRRLHNRKTDNTKTAEVVSQQPLQALLTSESTSLSHSKKYLTEGNSQRQASKSRSHNNKLFAISAKATTQAYSSTVATTVRAISTKAGAVDVKRYNSTTAMSNTTAATITTTTYTQPTYALQQLLRNKSIAVLDNNPQTQYFDGNTNHLSQTSPTATTFLTTSTSTVAAPPTTSAATSTTTFAAAPGVTTKKSIRISTQKLLATPFHQLTYVRNNAGDIDIDNIDNISVYPDLLEESSETAEQYSTERANTDVTRNSRLTIVSGYLPTSATAILPESIRLAKVKINKERKRMMALRQKHARRPA